MRLNEYDHIFIIGSTKCGSTALFKYLDAHPEIEGTVIKESRFFLDEAYPLQKEKLNSFSDYFSSTNEGLIKLDSTPDYLYCENSAESIKKYVDSVAGNSLIIVIVREPLSRLISYYNYGVQKDIFGTEFTFNQFVQDSFKGNLKIQHPISLAFRQCNYSEYIEKYIEHFGSDNVIVFDAKQLKEAPEEVLTEISKKVSIIPKFYKNYNFAMYNETIVPKNRLIGQLYNKSEQLIRERINSSSIFFSFLAKMKPYVDFLYKKVNGATKDVQLDSYTLSEIVKLIKTEKARLNRIGVSVKW